MLIDTSIYSQVDVVDTLKKFVREDISADVANDAAFQFVSDLTGISTDELAEYVFE